MNTSHTINKKNIYFLFRNTDNKRNVLIANDLRNTYLDLPINLNNAHCR